MWKARLAEKRPAWQQFLDKPGNLNGTLPYLSFHSSLRQTTGWVRAGNNATPETLITPNYAELAPAFEGVWIGSGEDNNIVLVWKYGIIGFMKIQEKNRMLSNIPD